MQSSDSVIVVSGLPRSGTSMMMRMLTAGGLEMVSDGERVADDDNPHGYFELERVKQLSADSSWVKDAHGKVVKVISQLLFDLPKDQSYKVLFMRRHIDEIMASQREMLKRKGTPSAGGVDDDEVRRLSIQHLNEIIDWLGQQPNMKVLYVNYGRTADDGAVDAIASFLDCGLDRAKMAAAIDKKLYRNRSGK